MTNNQCDMIPNQIFYLFNEYCYDAACLFIKKTDFQENSVIT